MRSKLAAVLGAFKARRNMATTAAELGGFGLVTWGAWSIHAAAGRITGGVLLVLAGWLAGGES